MIKVAIVVLAYKKCLANIYVLADHRVCCLDRPPINSFKKSREQIIAM